MVQTATLVKIAAGGFLAGSTALYLAQKSVQRKVRNLPHYKESLEVVAQHDQAKDALGPPIKVGSVDLADRRHNFVGKTTSMLRIPVTGTISAGYMDVMAVREHESEPFVTAKIRLMLNEAAVIIYDTEGGPEMAISDLIRGIQDVAWPEFLQPHVEVLLLWITWAVEYIDLDYLEVSVTFVT
ncbi:putative GTP cyclohydrolase I feedback regulatory protein [Trichostrongylus colubriformis]|uniref:GTP cyclohydrolase I feedback regulatory protein n=1 Tax=Trichostrongylus colubriformis TaxID=6319 RepID=A0AAN8IZP4_TRICO